MTTITTTRDSTVEEVLGSVKTGAIIMPDGDAPGVMMRMNSGRKPTERQQAHMRSVQKVMSRRDIVLHRLQQKCYINRLLRDGPPPHPPTEKLTGVAAPSAGAGTTDD